MSLAGHRAQKWLEKWLEKSLERRLRRAFRGCPLASIVRCAPADSSSMRIALAPVVVEGTGVKSGRRRVARRDRE